MEPRAGARPATRRGAVLVLDGDQASALAIVRSLARRGLRVEVASTSTDAIARRSRHAAACWLYPDPLASASAFLDWLQSHLAGHDYELVIPVTERTVIPLAQERQRFAPGLIAVADAEALAAVVDKQRTVALAQSLGILVPRAESVARLAEATAAAARIGYPVVVKPARSVGSRDGQRVQLSVSYAFDARELENQVESALRFGPVLLQEYFAGDGVGIELIADHGEPRYLFQHRRLHEVPLTGGGSSLRVAETPDPVLAEAATQLMRALRWHGVAMVEFKRNPANGDYRLMEINGRFWGSLPLAVAAGADFPGMLHALMTRGDVGPCAPARPGTVARQLARDVDWLEHVMRRHAPARLVRYPGTAEVLRDCLLVLSPRHHFDVQSWRDPWPGLVDLGRLVGRQWQRATSRLAERRRRAQARQHSLALLAQLGRAAPPARPRQVLFLCYGNINRSALAHAHAAQRAHPAVAPSSAGFHPEAGRPADPVMQQVAGALGVDLGQWQSQRLSAAQVQQADLILAMEVAHLDRLEHEFPGSRAKAALLDPTDAADLDIPDPYGRPRPVYEQVAARVRTAVDRWWAALAVPASSATWPSPAARPAGTAAADGERTA
jgi:protein-tyrosine-phosphatase/predicted ATP-grasp superfamily ATP-dependent carboligase